MYRMKYIEGRDLILDAEFEISIADIIFLISNIKIKSLRSRAGGTKTS